MDRLTLRTNIAHILSEHGGAADWPHAFELARLVLENREISHALRLRDEVVTEGARLAQCFAQTQSSTPDNKDKQDG